LTIADISLYKKTSIF